jgi:hypothetical protein
MRGIKDEGERECLLLRSRTERRSGSGTGDFVTSHWCTLEPLSRTIEHAAKLVHAEEPHANKPVIIPADG